MIQAESVHSTPPLDTSVSQNKRQLARQEAGRQRAIVKLRRVCDEARASPANPPAQANHRGRQCRFRRGPAPGRGALARTCRSVAALLEVLIGARPCAACVQAGTVLFRWPAASLKNNPRLDGDVSQHTRLLEGCNLLRPWRQHASRFQRFSGVGVPIPVFLGRLHGPNSCSETQASLIASVY